MEPLSASKFVAGYGATGFVKAFSIGSKIAIMLLLGWLIWVGLIQPFTKYRVASTVQKAEKIVNIENKPMERNRINLLWGAVKLW